VPINFVYTLDKDSTNDLPQSI